MKFGSHHYRPLIDELTIKESKINGLGLHATENIKAGVFLGATHIWERRRHGWIRTPLGGFINHSDEPNSFIHTNIYYHEGNQRELFTVKPIKTGEEITVFYTVGYNDIIE
jgi:SET domain-containing protein